MKIWRVDIWDASEGCCCTWFSRKGEALAWYKAQLKDGKEAERPRSYHVGGTLWVFALFLNKVCTKDNG